MLAAVAPRTYQNPTRMLVVNASEGTFRDGWIHEFPAIVQPGDVVVLNDAATLPASLRARSDDGSVLEVRLAQTAKSGESFPAVLFDEKDWRTKTEDRQSPKNLPVGSWLRFGPDLCAQIVLVSEQSPRLVHLRFLQEGRALWTGIYRYGRAVQYAYLRDDLSLWDVQSRFASRPWAVEPPSAGVALHWDVLQKIKEHGAVIATVTHGAGLSSTGDPVLDSILPLPERFDIPQGTVDAIAHAKKNHKRVIAVGTTVVRALEGCAIQNHGEIRAMEGVTDIILGPTTKRSIVNGILTGIHETDTSHYQLLHAFSNGELLLHSHNHAERWGYQTHEFGDTALVLGT